MTIGLVHISQRVDTWGRYVLWGLRKWFPQHEAVWCCERTDIDQRRFSSRKCDVYLRVEDSGGYATPEFTDGRTFMPVIYWCGDTHVQDGVDRKSIAAAADYTFVAQRNAVSLTGRGREATIFRADGSKEGIGDEWLPHAAWFYPEGKGYRTWLSSACTMPSGNSLFAERRAMADLILEWKRRNPHRIVIRPGVYFRDMEVLYADSLMVWHHSVNNDLAMRHFEAAACGAAVVCSKVENNGLEDCFGDLPMQYQSAGELLAVLDHAQSEAGIADMKERGRELRKLAEQRHSYYHRLQRIVEKAEELVYRWTDGERRIGLL